MRILRALPGICFFSLPMLRARRECQGRVRRMVPRRCIMVFNGDTGKVLNARSGEAAQEATLELRPFTAKGNHRPNHTRNLSAGRLRARMKYSTLKDASGGLSSSDYMYSWPSKLIHISSINVRDVLTVGPYPPYVITDGRDRGIGRLLVPALNSLHLLNSRSDVNRSAGLGQHVFHEAIATSPLGVTDIYIGCYQVLTPAKMIW